VKRGPRAAAVVALLLVAVWFGAMILAVLYGLLAGGGA